MMVFTTLSLRAKIISIFIAMIAIVLVGEGGMLWYSSRIETILQDMVDKEFVLYRTAQDMELALVNQKGLLTYYLVDGDTKWLKELGQYRTVFYQYLERAKDLDLHDRQRAAIAQIGAKFREYTEAKDLAIENYQSTAKIGSVSILHEKQRDIFFALLELCNKFSHDQWRVIQKAEEMGRDLTRKLGMFQAGAIAIFLALALFLIFVLYRYILGPIRGLAIETGGPTEKNTLDEVDSLTTSLKGMIKDFDDTSDELARSRRHLLQAERMAMVGELAAGVAHTIRNPFTSIKMRMFSLGRSLDLNVVQNEDLQVIGEEIARIDKIVQNFLEFARTPKLTLEACSLADIIRSALTLLEYRLKAYGVVVEYSCQPDLGPVLVDADRIKEALVNLITNACEAMETGGRITIAESRGYDPVMGEIAIIAVGDSGPGIPVEIIDKITTPFFTTKEEGSGLGLSIVARIAREHYGKLVVAPPLGSGALFLMQLPIKGRVNEPYSDN